MVNKLEQALCKTAEFLAVKQVARIFKVPENWQQTPCDFFGYTSKGKAILIEAKMVDRPSLPIGKAPGLKPHQWNALLEGARAGCLALICWQRGDECVTLSVSLARELAGARKSIPWKEVDRYSTHSIKTTHKLLYPYLTWVRL